MILSLPSPSGASFRIGVSFRDPYASAMVGGKGNGLMYEWLASRKLHFESGRDSHLFRSRFRSKPPLAFPSSVVAETPTRLGGQLVASIAS